MVSFVGGSASKVDDVTALPSRQKIADMCYYGNIMTTTRWWLCFTILHLQQYSHRLNFGGGEPPLGTPLPYTNREMVQDMQTFGNEVYKEGPIIWYLRTKYPEGITRIW